MILVGACLAAGARGEKNVTLKVIGTGVGRTGTNSLRLALNELGLGPCHHMEEVAMRMPVQVPLWRAAVDGHADWAAIYQGYLSAVDWPTAGFFRELFKAYPDAKFVHTLRSPESWVASFSETIYLLMSGRDQAPPHMQLWFDMAIPLLAKSGFPSGLDKAGLEKAFLAHNEAVKAAIPAKSLLVYEVRQGWEPLCAFLGVPVPANAFPKTNNREGFWEIVKRASAPPA